MKNFICIVALCLVAVQAFPDELIKLESDALLQALEESVPTTEATATVEEAKPRTTKSQGTAADRTRLVTELFKTYNKKINPDDVKLEFGVNLVDFHVLEKEDAVESYVWLRQDWADPRLKWDPKDYGGVELIRLDAEDVWKPDVTLYNSADPVNMVNCWHSNVLIYSSGKVLWVPPCKMTSTCHLNLRREPYGENMCSFKFGSWTFDGNILDIQLFNKTAGMDVSNIINTSGFEIVGNVAERNDVYYPCCEEPYPNLTFNLTVKRIPGEELFHRH